MDTEIDSKSILDATLPTSKSFHFVALGLLGPTRAYLGPTLPTSKPLDFIAPGLIGLPRAYLDANLATQPSLLKRMNFKPNSIKTK